MLLNVARAQRVLGDEGLDGLIGATPENLLYLSGLETSGHRVSRYTTNVFALVARDDLTRPYVVGGLGEAGAVRQLCPPGTRSFHYGAFTRYVDASAELDEHEAWVKEWVVDTKPRANAVEALAAALEEAGLARARVGYDERGIDPATADAVSARLSGLELVPAFTILRRIRLVKTPEEIDRLTQSLRLTEQAIEAAIAIAAPGVQEEDMIREFRRTVVAAGGDPLFNEITFGRRAAVGPSPIQDGVLAEGNIIRFDVGCKVEGYCSDIARIFVFRGEVPERGRRLYAALVAGEDHAMSVMRPGATARDAFEAGVDATRTAGIQNYERNHVGHAVGLEVYDGCLLAPSDETPLEPGMTFEVETPYYELGFLGLQIEDTVVVRDDGAEMLTRLSREIEPVE